MPSSTAASKSTAAPRSAKAASQLEVLLNDRHIGIIEKTSTGKPRLIYDEAWIQHPKAIPVSQSLPTSTQRHDTTRTANFMWNLLPDNGATLNRWAIDNKISANNPFALLAYVGEDCPGAIQLVAPDNKIAGREGVTWLTDGDMHARVRALRADPGATRAVHDTGRVSLAGAQTKTALYRTGDKWGVPNGRTPTTHILKPEPMGFPGLAMNEHFCLQLMRTIGLPTPDSEVVDYGEIPVFVVKRYDRHVANGSVRRIHQEDMCQAHGIPPSKKYQQDGGPGVPEIMNMLQKSQNPEEDRSRFMRALAFNFVIANSDAHAKNFSIVYAPGGIFRLAPFYDVASLMAFASGPKSLELAMTIGGNKMMNEILPKHWIKTAQRAGFEADVALAHVRDLIARLPGSALGLRYEIKQQQANRSFVVVDQVIDRIWERIRSLANAYGSELL
jgi:serine/threonine-protein kinase HipA